MRVVTIQQALQHVANNPVMQTDVVLDVRVHELVARTLFEIANKPHLNERGSMTRANVARNMIFNRLVGRRRTGSHPARASTQSLTFVDLTGREVQQ
jgi:hypothetical protein